MNDVMIDAAGVRKSFTLHLRGGLKMPVLLDAAIEVRAGECVALVGPSGAGKSTLMRALYGNYLVDGGHIRIRHRGALVDIATADPRLMIEIRRETLGYVSQFLRAVPRVAARDVVAEPLMLRGVAQDEARDRASAMMLQLNLPKRLHGLPPSTFSGGEQQRVNLARGFLAGHPILLLDEPTASLDDANRAVVIELMAEAKRAGIAMIGIFHDSIAREAIADRLVSLTALQDAA
jgi:alpha-D-ribose 1-methylphosphonate 5-triphosphate synthase subunit PhnL